MILAPTRELAVQVTDEINRFAKDIGIRAVTIYGGQSINLQLDKLRRGVQIIVATPGRLIDHIKQGSIILDDVRFVVLDEADRMLDMGFIDDIKFILFYVSEDRQTCLFSATMPPEILRLAEEYMRQNKIEHVRLNEEEITLETIDQSYLVVEEREKFKHLVDFIRRNQNAKSQTIVFAATKQRADRLAYKLRQEGFSAVTIHGDLSQKQRDNAMHKFKRGTEDMLVATDIAARGIDVPAVGNVINYDVPEDPNVYFHRIGRTARAGGEGNAISLVSNDRISDFGRILAQTKLPIRKLNDELGVIVPVIAQRQPSFGRGGGYRWRGGYGSRAATVMSGVAADDAMAAVTAEEVPVAIAAAEAATVMSGVAADDAMAAVTAEEVPVAIAAARARQDMAAIEGAVAMATAADTAAVITITTTTISRHTVFKARWLFIF